MLFRATHTEFFRQVKDGCKLHEGSLGAMRAICTDPSPSAI
jgi:hypothetical protein